MIRKRDSLVHQKQAAILVLQGVEMPTVVGSPEDRESLLYTVTDLLCSSLLFPTETEIPESYQTLVVR